MPIRIVPLVNNEYYHILNRGNGLIPIFKTKFDYQKFVDTIFYYQNNLIPIRYSKFITLPLVERKKILDELKIKKDFLVEIVSFCLMPNHFHLILKQQNNNGILNFLRHTSNSYSHYFNTRYKRKGSLFEGRFKSIRIVSNYQLLHLSRYIHLNPYSSFIVKHVEDLKDYPYSSLQEHLGYKKESCCQKEIILGQFKDKDDYEKFILDQADYQRNLDIIKHQLME